jgi:hypothetical protein
MNKRSKFIAQLAFYGLALGLFAYAASRTLEFVQNTMPADKAYLGYLYLLATGVGALIWPFVGLSYAEGAKQRGIAFVMGILDLVAELTLVYADTVRVSAENQMLTMSQNELQTFIFASVLAVGLNIAAAYFFKLFDPAAETLSKARDLVDEVNDAAMKQLNTPSERQKMINELSPILRGSVLAEVTDQVYQMSGALLGDNQHVGLASTLFPGAKVKYPDQPEKKRPFDFLRPAPKPSNQVPTQENPGAVWTVDENGEKRKIFCLQCFYEGKPWTNPEPCEHILNMKGTPGTIHSTGPTKLPTNMPRPIPHPVESPIPDSSKEKPTYHPMPAASTDEETEGKSPRPFQS